MSVTRDEIVLRAREWIGTPYHHQASRKGVGCDCLGLVRGLWREIRGGEPEPLPAYSPDWAEASGHETLLEAARRHLAASQPLAARPGDVLVFRLFDGARAKHAGVMATPSTMIHAQEGSGVLEVHLGRWWRRRIAGAFSFPDLVD